MTRKDWVLGGSAPRLLRGLSFRTMLIIINKLLDMEHCRGRKPRGDSHRSLTKKWKYSSALKQQQHWGGQQWDKLTFWDQTCFPNTLKCSVGWILCVWGGANRYPDQNEHHSWEDQEVGGDHTYIVIAAFVVLVFCLYVDRKLGQEWALGKKYWE